MKKDILAVVDIATRFTKQFFFIYFELVVLELHGSGGHIFADVTDEQAKKADLDSVSVFLLQLANLRKKMQKYFCMKCESEFDGS